MVSFVCFSLFLFAVPQEAGPQDSKLNSPARGLALLSFTAQMFYTQFVQSHEPASHRLKAAVQRGWKLT